MNAPACPVCGSSMVYLPGEPEELFCEAAEREPGLHAQLAEARDEVARLRRALERWQLLGRLTLDAITATDDYLASEDACIEARLGWLATLNQTDGVTKERRFLEALLELRAALAESEEGA